MGILYVVSTPIGNLRDITLRALDILREVNIIACEDTRVTRKLLNHYGIKGKKLISYHEHNEERVSEDIIKLLSDNDVALVSDAGTPCISDPGYRVVKKAWEKGFKVSPIPGPFAGVTALSASGLPSDKFIFLGFLPHKEKQKEKLLKEYMHLNITMIMYESPHRLISTLKILNSLTPDSFLVVAKEITKIHEQFIRGKVSEVLNFFQENESIIKGEFVLLCYPEEKKDISEEEILEKARELKEKGIKIKEISKIISEMYGLKKNQIYKLLLEKGL